MRLLCIYCASTVRPLALQGDYWAFTWLYWVATGRWLGPSRRVGSSWGASRCICLVDCVCVCSYRSNVRSILRCHVSVRIPIFTCRLGVLVHYCAIYCATIVRPLCAHCATTVGYCATLLGDYCTLLGVYCASTVRPLALLHKESLGTSPIVTHSSHTGVAQ